MANNRAETLKSILEQDPGNTLARYGLAMEYATTGQLDAAVTEFEALIAHNPDYPYAYFHGGQTLERLGRMDDARQLYERGIGVSARLGDQHARSELQGALDLLG